MTPEQELQFLIHHLRPFSIYVSEEGKARQDTIYLRLKANRFRVFMSWWQLLPESEQKKWKALVKQGIFIIGVDEVCWSILSFSGTFSPEEQAIGHPYTRFQLEVLEMLLPVLADWYVDDPMEYGDE